MEIQIRLAQPSDMQAIIEMSKDIYDGHDYFPLVFLRWLDDPNRRILVAEKESTIVGLTAYYVVDEGRTVINQGLRVHPQYRGQGMCATLMKAGHQYIKTNFPSVKTERYTTSSSIVKPLAIPKADSFGLGSLILEFANIAFYIDSADDGFSSFVARSVDEASRVGPLSIDGFRDLLEDRKLDDIVMKNTLIIDWEVFQAHPSNISNGLIMDGDCLLTSTKIASNGTGIESLSHGRQSPTMEHQVWVTTFYTFDEKLLKIHIAKQVECAVFQIKEPFILSCFLPTSLVSCAKVYLSDQLSLKAIDHSPSFIDLLLFERDLTS